MECINIYNTRSQNMSLYRIYYFKIYFIYFISHIQINNIKYIFVEILYVHMHGNER